MEIVKQQTEKHYNNNNNKRTKDLNESIDYNACFHFLILIIRLVFNFLSS